MCQVGALFKQQQYSSREREGFIQWCFVAGSHEQAANFLKIRRTGSSNALEFREPVAKNLEMHHWFYSPHALLPYFIDFNNTNCNFMAELLLVI